MHLKYFPSFSHSGWMIFATHCPRSSIASNVMLFFKNVDTGPWRECIAWLDGSDGVECKRRYVLAKNILKCIVWHEPYQFYISLFRNLKNVVQLPDIVIFPTEYFLPRANSLPDHHSTQTLESKQVEYVTGKHYGCAEKNSILATVPWVNCRKYACSSDVNTGERVVNDYVATTSELHRNCENGIMQQ